jgi:hypothetical protein
MSCSAFTCRVSRSCSARRAATLDSKALPVPVAPAPRAAAATVPVPVTELAPPSAEADTRSHASASALSQPSASSRDAASRHHVRPAPIRCSFRPRCFVEAAAYTCAAEPSRAGDQVIPNACATTAARRCGGGAAGVTTSVCACARAGARAPSDTTGLRTAARHVWMDQTMGVGQAAHRAQLRKCNGSVVTTTTTAAAVMLVAHRSLVTIVPQLAIRDIQDKVTRLPSKLGVSSLHLGGSGCLTLYLVASACSTLPEVAPCDHRHHQPSQCIRILAHETADLLNTRAPSCTPLVRLDHNDIHITNSDRCRMDTST